MIQNFEIIADWVLSLTSKSKKSRSNINLKSTPNLFLSLIGIKINIWGKKTDDGNV